MPELPGIRLNEVPLKRLQAGLESLLERVPSDKRRELLEPLLTFEERAKNEKEDYCQNGAEVLVAAALVNQNRWTTVAKRLRRFRQKYRSVTTVRRLDQLIRSLDDRQVCEGVLDWAYSRKHSRHDLLRGLSMAFVRYQQKKETELGRPVSDFDLYRRWARDRKSVV